MMALEQAKPTCKYCGKQFSRESSLAVHMCETKRRWSQENETGVRLGFQAWLRFYELTQGSAKTKTYATFVDSPYYSAFVRFGQVMVQLRVVNTRAYTDFVIKSNKKLDHWTKDSLYDEFLLTYLRKEHPQDALERSLLEAQRWADDNNESFIDVFRKGSPNRVCQMISNGRISPWVVFNCDSGQEFLGRLNQEQVASIFSAIDPEFWGRRLHEHLADSEYIKEVLKGAGL